MENSESEPVSRAGAQKKGIHYAWKILIACCLINMSALGLTNTNGLFYSAICADLGFQLSSLMIHTTFCGLTSAAVLLVVDRIYQKYPVRRVLLLGFVCFHGSMMLMSTFTAVWQFCLAAVLNGVGCAFLFYVPVPMLLNSWFIKRKKLALSLCFVAAGTSGILFSLLMGVVISRAGWRLSYLIRSGIALLLAVPALLLIVKTPQERGLSPYGAGAENSGETEQRLMGESASCHTLAEKRRKYYGAVALAVLGNMVCAVTSMLAHYSGTLGYDIVFGSYMTSLAMVGNIGSKALMGPAAEKYGIRSSGIVISALLGSGFFLVGLVTEAAPAVLLMSVTTGISACANTLIVPNVLDTFARGDEYVHMLARCSTGTMLASAFTNVIGSALADHLGYRPAFVIYGCLCVMIILILAVVYRPARRAGMRNHPGRCRDLWEKSL